ncbi:MAG: hypothetical protein P9L96_00750 [Candidatus Gygaella obscura]|nr:hypothetical protein [Candidatus Gygaella obscura]
MLSDKLFIPDLVFKLITMIVIKKIIVKTNVNLFLLHFWYFKVINTALVRLISPRITTCSMTIICANRKIKNKIVPRITPIASKA